MRTLEAAPEHLGGGRFSAPSRRRRCGRSATSMPAGRSARISIARPAPPNRARGARSRDLLRTDWETVFPHPRRQCLRPGADLVTPTSAPSALCGDLARALKEIRARVLLLPGRPICTSASPTIVLSSPTSPTPSCVRSRASGATAPAIPPRPGRCGVFEEGRAALAGVAVEIIGRRRRSRLRRTGLWARSERKQTVP